jgi:hypothetical protein
LVCPVSESFCDFCVCLQAQGCTCGPGKTFSKVVVNLGDGATEVNWGQGIGFCALSRAMSGDCVGINGDVTYSRLQRITTGKVRNTFLQEDKRLQDIHAQTLHANAHLDFEALVDWAYSFLEQRDV